MVKSVPTLDWNLPYYTPYIQYLFPAITYIVGVIHPIQEMSSCYQDMGMAIEFPPHPSPKSQVNMAESLPQEDAVGGVSEAP